MRASVFALAIPLVAALPRVQPIEDSVSAAGILSRLKKLGASTVTTIRTERNGKVTSQTFTSDGGAEGSESFDINSILPDHSIDDLIKPEQVAAPLPQPPTVPNVGSTAAATTPEIDNTVYKPVTSTDAAPETDNAVEDDFIDIANKWRKHMGLPGSYIRSQILINHALKASQNSTIKELNHSPLGSYAQVMATKCQKYPDNFEMVYVGAWLCEMPELVENDDPTMKGQQCSMYNDNEYVYNTKDHAKYLSTAEYIYMGCAEANKVWTCSLSVEKPKSD